jgi:nucleoside-diphosphate-sugar epimerase
MRILVTGATGFLGGALVRRALAAGHEVCALVRPGSALGPARPELTVCRGTLAAPPWGDLARFGAQSCVHAAWITTPGVYPESPDNDRYRDESLTFLATLFARGVGHAVVVGTSAEYRPSPEPLDEVSPLEPRSRYARAKHALRLVLAERAAAAGARVAWARVFQPYGVGEHPDRLCSAVVRRVRAGERVTLDNPGAVRDWIHADDVAGALLCLAESGAAAVVNVGSGVGRTVGSVALAIASRLRRPDLLVMAPPQPDPLGPLVADATRLRALGWAPRVELDDGLTALIDALR